MAAGETTGGSAAGAGKVPSKSPARKAAKSPGKAKAARKPAKPRRSARVKAVEEAARAYFDAVSARDPDAMAAKWHSEGIEDIVPLGIFRGPAGVRELFTEMFAAIPDMAFTVERITADAEGAVVQWRAAGTFTGSPFQGIDATDRFVELRGADCLEIDADGLLTRNTAYYDGFAFARGVGMLPPEHSPADKAIRTGFNAMTKVRRAVGGAR